MALGTRDNRKDSRRAINRPAWLVLDSATQPVLCMLVNISSRGAKLNVQPDAELPDNFDLAISADHSVLRHCRVAWRDGASVGVRFTDVRDGDRPRRRAAGD